MSGQASASESGQQPHNQWVPRTARTSKCDFCQNRNKSVLQQCSVAGCRINVCKDCFDEHAGSVHDGHFYPAGSFVDDDNSTGVDWLPLSRAARGRGGRGRGGGGSRGGGRGRGIAHAAPSPVRSPSGGVTAPYGPAVRRRATAPRFPPSYYTSNNDNEETGSQPATPTERVRDHRSWRSVVVDGDSDNNECDHGQYGEDGCEVTNLSRVSQASSSLPGKCLARGTAIGDMEAANILAALSRSEGEGGPEQGGATGAASTYWLPTVEGALETHTAVPYTPMASMRTLAAAAVESASVQAGNREQRQDLVGSDKTRGDLEVIAQHSQQRSHPACQACSIHSHTRGTARAPFVRVPAPATPCVPPPLGRTPMSTCVPSFHGWVPVPTGHPAPHTAGMCFPNVVPPHYYQDIPKHSYQRLAPSPASVIYTLNGRPQHRSCPAGEWFYATTMHPHAGQITVRAVRNVDDTITVTGGKASVMDQQQLRQFQAVVAAAARSCGSNNQFGGSGHSPGSSGLPNGSASGHHSGGYRVISSVANTSDASAKIDDVQGYEAGGDGRVGTGDTTEEKDTD